LHSSEAASVIDLSANTDTMPPALDL
jgi:hypothetical protein